MDDKSYINFLEESISMQRHPDPPCEDIVSWRGEGSLKTYKDTDIDYLVKKINKGDGIQDKAITSDPADVAPISVLENELDNEEDNDQDDSADDLDVENECSKVKESVDLSEIESDVLSRLISEMDAMDEKDDDDEMLDNDDMDYDNDDSEDLEDNDLNTEDVPDEDENNY